MPAKSAPKFTTRQKCAIGALGRCALGLVAVAAASPALGADLDRGAPYPPLAPRYAPYPPPAGYAMGPSCRQMWEPEMNLYNEVTRSRRVWVCVSRGVYADTLWPYPRAPY